MNLLSLERIAPEAVMSNVTELNIGFMPLTDCAPIVMAHELGLFRKYGLKVTLDRQNSWATLRDKLHAGLLDAVQMLAPMPFASTLGIGGQQHPVMTPFVLSFNGNAITISQHLSAEIVAINNLNKLSLPLSSGLLKKLIAMRKSNGKKVRFATVHPNSCHYYQLMSWLKMSGISLAEISIVVLPPSEMVTALEEDYIDAFCVGGPWNAEAVRKGAGTTVLTSSDIWSDSPEKVLGVSQFWYQQNQGTTQMLIAALQESCHWLEHVPNRFEAARVLATRQYLDTNLDVIAPSLLGSCLTQRREPPRRIPSYNQFSMLDKPNGNAPEHTQGERILQYMVEAGHIDRKEIPEALISNVYRSDIYERFSQITADIK
ncbi:CmpA/NrtA family ABC transporter substrate-binding protein [Vibrio tapetis subsp. quintayensis]|uniref:CmpA/NrtA family ABC transporter substrate-binding protein n=1 Tax=Vibrio tapetis TaxID=52443 RepID=UPI0025B612D6|nr:CmpA/NrtA family ABC transporter substrate-binding protein [Vibrio tapetis]MDN3680302.1 CmpA/NrtA family ABC transporter substrate-binding protein [Vibrio tapetis subsp. quintayensis]